MLGRNHLHNMNTAAPSGHSERPVTTIGHWFRNIRRAHQRRDEYLHLLSLEDHMLEDLGYNRGVIRARVGRPPHTDAHILTAHQYTQGRSGSAYHA